MMRSTSMSGSSGSRTRVGKVSASAKAGPSMRATDAAGELQAHVPVEDAQPSALPELFAASDRRKLASGRRRQG